MRFGLLFGSSRKMEQVGQVGHPKELSFTAETSSVKFDLRKCRYRETRLNC